MITVDDKVLESAHDTDHKGIVKTLHRLLVDFHVLGAGTSVQNHVRACATCQWNNLLHLHPLGLLQSLGVPSLVWSNAAMDFI
jgi:hypothetical protein